MISKEMDAEWRAYATIKINDVVSKIRVPLWGTVSIEGGMVTFLTYHGVDAPCGQMSIPVNILGGFETRWVAAENDD